MKVIHLHSGKEGGAERFFVNLANSLHEMGVEQKFVIRPDSSRTTSMWHREIEHCGEIIKDHNRWYSRPFLKRQVARMDAEFQPDAIMAWMPRASQLLPKKSAAMRITRLGDFPKKLSHFRNADVIVGNVHGILKRCKKLGRDWGLEYISNFPREVNLQPVTRVSLDTPDDAFVISSAGRFVSRKGMDLIIRATAKLDNAWLWLVGAGELEDSLKSLAKEVGLDKRIRFLGWQKEPANYLTSTDIFCMASRHEPLGNVVFEAWQLGLPVVSSNSNGPSEFMTDGVNGLVIETVRKDDETVDMPNVVDDYATAFERLRSDEKLRDHLVRGGSLKLEQDFSKSAITQKYMNLFSHKKT